MAELPADAMEAASVIGASLDARDIPYAVGGALAFGIWSTPRGTLDVDLNVFVRDDQLGEVVDALRECGVDVNAERARRDAVAEGMFQGRFGDFRIDLFTPSIEFSWEAMRTRRQVSTGGRSLWVLAPEALAVFKLLFFRPKDLVDLERLAASRGIKLDTAYVRSHLTSLVGDDDERVKAWDRMVRDADTP